MNPWDGEIRDSWAPREDRTLIYDQIERPPRAEDQIRRTANGRAYVYKPDGSGKCLYSRVTTYIKCVDDVSLLTDWKIRMIMTGIAKRPLQAAAEIMRTWGSRTEMKKLAERFLDYGLEEDTAIIGTAVHALTERWDLNLPIPMIPDVYQGDLIAWQGIMKHFDITHIEHMMINDEIGTVGTPDRVLKYLPCRMCGKSSYILDLKTGRVDHYTELQIAMQLGIYANSAFYDFRSGTRMEHDFICRCKAMVVSLPAGSGEAQLKWFDIDSGWRVVRDVARRVREARNLKRLSINFMPVENLSLLIQRATSEKELNVLYFNNVANWTDEHTSAATARLAEISAEAS